MITLFLYHANLNDGGEVWGKCFTFILYLGSHTHISKTKFFNQNFTFKSIELLDRSEREKIFDWFLWIVGDSRCACLLLHLKVAFISLISCPGLAWGSSFLNLLNLLILDYSHQESILAFGCDELHLVPCAECWCECLHKVLFFLALWAFALTALTFSQVFCFGWTDGLLVVLLWLLHSKSFPIFLSVLSAIWQKALSCKDLLRHSWWHWPGTHTAPSVFPHN